MAILKNLIVTTLLAFIMISSLNMKQVEHTLQGIVASKESGKP